MRILAFSALVLGFGLVGFQLSACSNSADDCNATATCGATAGTSQSGSAGKAGGGNDGGQDNGGTSSGGSMSSSGASGTLGMGGAGGEGGGGVVACSGDVADDPACWTTDELGVFVSSEHGSDASGDGTKAAPFATIGKGIGAAAGKNIYVCVGAADYTEQLTFNEAVDGLHVYGGFECETWTYSVTRNAQVLSPKSIALRVASLKKGLYLENLQFKAADASGADASSYGAFITDSSNVVFKRVALTAGAGLKGKDGKDGGKGDDGALVGKDQNGEAALCGGVPADGVPGKWPAPICGSKGGNGGAGLTDTNGDNGSSGIPSANVTPPNKVNLGTGATDSLHGGDGSEGSSGDAGVLGTAAAAAGLFTASGFATANGHDGSNGFPGQGGGGGGASKGSATCRGASGGAGGMGGCGGSPGLAGGGGGASVGLFSWNSDLQLFACRITSGAGGAGGTGGKGGSGGGGAVGGVGGQGDQGNGIARGGNGGQGGPGGNGGSGSGGTGGPSYAVVYSGTTPVYTEPDTALTAPLVGGAKGDGGKVLSAQAPSGTDGAAGKVFKIP